MKKRARRAAPGIRRRTSGGSPRTSKAASRGKAQPKKAGCARVPVCLLDALRAGAAVEVGRAGEKWTVTADGKAIAKRKHRHAAEELLEAAREEVARSLAAA